MTDKKFNSLPLANQLRTNVDPSPLLDEQVAYSKKGGYVDWLIKFNQKNFWNKRHRRFSQDLDPLVLRLTKGFAKMMLSKPFKIWDFQGEEILPEYSEWFYSMNLQKPARKAADRLELNGHVIVNFFMKIDQLDYRIYGDLECPPMHWKRRPDNQIYNYHISYTPSPRPGSYERATLRSVNKNHSPEEVVHTTRYEDEYGYGISRILHIWDSIIKLRRGSHADAFRRAVKFILGVPPNWDKDRVKGLLDAIKDSSENLALAYRVGEDKQGDPLPDLPFFGYRSMADDAPSSRSSTTIDTGDPEIDRFLMGLGYTKNWLIGNQGGKVTGSEVDLSRDDAEDIAEWGVSIGELIKDWFNYFYEAGFLPEPIPAGARIVSWKEWEFKEQMESMMEMQEQETKARDDEAKSKAERHNSSVEMSILNSLRLNMSMPFTPVMSSWIKDIAYSEDERSLIMTTHDKPSTAYAYPRDYAMDAYTSWIDSGSKGGYWWDYIRDTSDHAQKLPKSTFSDLQTGFGLGAVEPGEKTREYKKKGEPEKGIIGAGETREPFEAVIPDEQKKQKPTKMPIGIGGLNPTKPTQPMATTSEKGVLTPGYVHDPSSITGSKKVGPGRKRKRGRKPGRSSIVPYNLSGNSVPKKLNSIPEILASGDEIDWNMSKNTAYNLKELFEAIVAAKYRVNSIAMGNEMAFDIPLFYKQNGEIVKEYACKKSFRKVENHKGPIKLYRDGGHSGEAHKVGEYERLGWDDENDIPKLKMNYDNDEIVKLLKEWGREDSYIIERINNGEIPEMSTEYYCSTIEGKDGKTYQTKIRNSKGEPKYEGIAIVEIGNCPSGKCDFEAVDEIEEEDGTKITVLNST